MSEKTGFVCAKCGSTDIQAGELGGTISIACLKCGHWKSYKAAKMWSFEVTEKGYQCVDSLAHAGQE